MEWMPVYVHRLRRSELYAIADAEEFRAAFLLWCEAYQSKPAGSLPNSDAQLRTLAGLRGSPEIWERVKIRALHGFVECSDGRLYHRVVSELAIEAWNIVNGEIPPTKNALRQRRFRERRRAGAEVSPRPPPLTGAQRMARYRAQEKGVEAGTISDEVTKKVTQKALHVTSPVTPEVTKSDEKALLNSVTDFCNPLNEKANESDETSRRYHTLDSYSVKTERKKEREPPLAPPARKRRQLPLTDLQAEAAPIPDWMPVQAWSDFAENRAAIGHPLTAPAVRNLVAKLDRARQAGQDPAAMLAEATMAGYRGVFPVRRGLTDPAPSGQKRDRRSLAQRFEDQMGLSPSPSANGKGRPDDYKP